MASFSIKSGNTLAQGVQILRNGVALDLTGCTGLKYSMVNSEAIATNPPALEFTETLADNLQLTVSNAAEGRIVLNGTAARMNIIGRRIESATYYGAFQCVHPVYGTIEAPSDTFADTITVNPQVIL